MVAIRQEQWAEAERALEESVMLARTLPYPYAEARLLRVCGEMHIAKGEPEPAREPGEGTSGITRCAGGTLRRRGPGGAGPGRDRRRA